MKRRSPQSGFSLIELMIVVGIIGILAAIAIPQYSAYIYRAKQSEGLTMIGTIKIAEETHLAHRDCYVNVETTPAAPVSPVAVPWVSVVMASLPCTDVTDRSFEDISVRPGAGLLYYRYNCRARVFAVSGTPDDFTCNVVGDIDGDNNNFEMVFGTDRDGDGMTIPSNTGAISNFPNDPIRVSPWIY